MQPLGAQIFIIKRRRRGAGPFRSLISCAAAHANLLSRIGFLLTLLFLASAALYGAMLSGRAGTFAGKASAFADRTLARAGLRVADLAMTGVKNTPSHAIIEALKLPYSGSILSYDTDAARDALLKLGFVATAEVRRVFPSRLDVAITERVPFARWQSGDTVFLCDREGRVLGPNESERFGNLPLVAGEGAPEAAASLVAALSNHGGLRGKIERATLVAFRFWELKFAGTMSAELPLKISDSALQRLQALLDSRKIASLDIKIIDLRQPRRTVLQLTDPTVQNRDKAIALLAGSAALEPPAPQRGASL